ncbi:MAG: hypothetical protein ACK5BE_05855 [Alphaproteobacteria bacterium]|jgi:hypothetical protein
MSKEYRTVTLMRGNNYVAIVEKTAEDLQETIDNLNQLYGIEFNISTKAERFLDETGLYSAMFNPEELAKLENHPGWLVKTPNEALEKLNAINDRREKGIFVTDDDLRTKLVLMPSVIALHVAGMSEIPLRGQLVIVANDEKHLKEIQTFLTKWGIVDVNEGQTLWAETKTRAPEETGVHIVAGINQESMEAIHFIKKENITMTTSYKAAKEALVKLRGEEKPDQNKGTIMDEIVKNVHNSNIQK